MCSFAGGGGESEKNISSKYMIIYSKTNHVSDDLKKKIQ